MGTLFVRASPASAKLLSRGERNRVIATALAYAIEQFRNQSIPKRFDAAFIGQAPFFYRPAPDTIKRKSRGWYAVAYGGPLPLVGTNRKTSGQTRESVINRSYVIPVGGSSPRATLRLAAPPYVNYNNVVMRVLKGVRWDEVREIQRDFLVAVDSLLKDQVVLATKKSGVPSRTALNPAARTVVGTWFDKDRRRTMAAQARRFIR